MTCDRAMAQTLSRKRQLQQDFIINHFDINSPCDKGKACLERGSWKSFLVALGRRRAMSNEAGLSDLLHTRKRLQDSVDSIMNNHASGLRHLYCNIGIMQDFEERSKAVRHHRG